MLKLTSSILLILFFTSVCMGQEAPELKWEEAKKEVVKTPSELELKVQNFKSEYDQLKQDMNSKYSSLESRVKKLEDTQPGLESFRPPTNPKLSQEQVKEVEQIAERIFATKFADKKPATTEKAKSNLPPTSTSDQREYKEGDIWQVFDMTYQLRRVGNNLQWVRLNQAVYSQSAPTVNYSTPVASQPVPVQQPIEDVMPKTTPFQAFRSALPGSRYVRLSNGCIYDTVTQRVVSCSAR